LHELAVLGSTISVYCYSPARPLWNAGFFLTLPLLSFKITSSTQDGMEKRLMNIKVNNQKVEIFSGALVKDVLRKYSRSALQQALKSKKAVFDSHGHEVELTGELSDGAELFVKSKENKGEYMKNKNLRSSKACLFLLSLIFIFGAPVFVAAKKALTETRIVIFHVNDIHSKIDNFAKMAWIIKEEKKINPNVFFFSAGDNFTGNPIVDQYDPPGEPILELFNRMDITLLCLGNHEFDFGQEILKKFAARGHFTMLGANIKAEAGAFANFRPYTVLKTGDGVRMAVFGLIQIETETMQPASHHDKLKCLTFSEPLATAKGFKKLRTGNQVFLALTHISYDHDLLLAQQMPELDAIIGGHSHTRVNPAEIVNGVLIAQAGADNRFLGRIELLVKDGRVVEKKGALIDLSPPLAEDAEIKAMIVKFNQNPVLAQVIATAPFAISGLETLGSLMTDAICKILGVDIAFLNVGGIRLNQLPLAITLKDVYTLDPFGNQIIQIVMTPAEIRDLIKNSCEKLWGIDLQVSGITYVVRADSAKQIKEVLLRNLDGSPLPEDKTYKVGLSSFIASSYKFAHSNPGHSLQITSVEALIRYLRSGPDLSIYRDLKRAFWEIIPENPQR
jgi:2',3'-cyclic-nucleotide 2'-phosphodiesterase (5'-nucleotidase family)